MRIAQSQSYRGNDWWDWSVWLEGTSAELDDIENVEWRLHPSFTPSQVSRRNRTENFRLSTSGWGTFPIRAVLRSKSGREDSLVHDLELFYPEEEEKSDPSPQVRGRAEVGVYLHEVDLPAIGPVSRGARAHLKSSNRAEDFDESQPLIVVGPQVVEFTGNVPARVRRTICHGLLLAQLAADKKVPDRGRFGAWYDAYSDVLGNIGWIVINAEVQSIGPPGEKAYRALPAALVASLGPSVAAGSALLRLVQDLPTIPPDLPWFSLLEKKVRQRAGLGLTRIGTSADGMVSQSSVFFQVQPSAARLPLLSLVASESDGLVQTMARNTVLSPQLLSAIESALAAKLEPFLFNNICIIGEVTSWSATQKSPANTIRPQ